MLGLIFAVFAFSGGIGFLTMAEPAQKPLGLIPPAMWILGYFSPVIFGFTYGELGTAFAVVLIFQGGGAAFGLFLFNKGRTQKMQRALED